MLIIIINKFGGGGGGGVWNKQKMLYIIKEWPSTANYTLFFIYKSHKFIYLLNIFYIRFALFCTIFVYLFQVNWDNLKYQHTTMRKNSFANPQERRWNTWGEEIERVICSRGVNNGAAPSRVHCCVHCGVTPPTWSQRRCSFNGSH